MTIGAWILGMLPAGATPGTDLVTQAHFPGTPAQRKELRAFGGFGSQVDPGNKLIFEWRNLTMNHPDELPQMVYDLLEFVRRAHTPTRWERFTGAVSSAATATTTFVTRVSQNPYIRAAAVVGAGTAAAYALRTIMMKPNPLRPHGICQLSARIVSKIT